MTQKNYSDDIAHIRDIMERSSRFRSLSGVSGILIGIYALGASHLVNSLLNRTDISTDTYRFQSSEIVNQIILIAIITLAVSLLTGILFSARRAMREGYPLWNITTIRLLINLLIPLATGGVIIIILILKGYIAFAAPFTLIFYGLALINASKYSWDELRYLGLLEILCGILGLIFLQYSIYFWALGFGVFHIIYGIIMYFKYEREETTEKSG